MFCSDIHYRSQPNQNSDQFYHFEIAILFVSILHRKLTQITAAGVEKEICNSVVQDDAHSWNEGLGSFSSGTEQFTQKQQRSKYQGGNSWFGVSPLNDLVELPVPLKKRSWARTPKDTSGFLPLKLKLDATSKLLSCPFFVAFIYVFLSAKAFSFAYCQCGHQSKSWIQTRSQTRTQLFGGLHIFNLETLFLLTNEHWRTHFRRILHHISAS